MSFTISDIKRQLGPGLGLRKSKYLLEIPVPGGDGSKINVLCQSTALPERSVSVVPIYHLGRKYNMRGETTYTGIYNISIIDDSKMALRKVFDTWLTLVDNSKPKNDGILGGAVGDLLNTVDGILTAANTLKTSFESDGGLSLLMNAFTGNDGPPLYQSSINIWQLGNNGEKIYGYKLENAFPSSVSTVELDDTDQSSLSQFSVDFTYSELIPLEDTTSTILGAVLGDNFTSINKTVDNLF